MCCHHIYRCPSPWMPQVVDLSHNSLEGDAVLSILAELSAVRVLYLQQNAVAQLPNYRRRLILNMAELRYLDDRPIEACLSDHLPAPTASILHCCCDSSRIKC